MPRKNLEDLNLNLLVVFEAIYSTKNVSQAAKLLGMSQPTVSNALARLRVSVGDQLFVRASNGVKPTTKATNMVGPVRESLRLIRSGLGDNQSFDPTSSQRHFRIVILDTLEPIFVPPVLSKIQNSSHSITLDSVPISGANIGDGLNDGSIDLVLAFYPKDVPDINCERIGDADVVLVSRRNHPQIDGSTTMEHLSTLGFIALPKNLRALSIVDEELSRKSITRKIVYGVTKFWSYPHIIANSDLCAILPGDFARTAAEVYPLDIHELPFEVQGQNMYLTWKKHREGDAGLMWLRDQFLAAYSALK